MLCVCMSAGCLVQGTGLYALCLHVCRLPGTRNRAVCFVFACLQAAWYKEQGCMLCVCMSAGCLVQGTGLYALCLCLQAAWYKEQGCMLCVCMSAGCLVQGTGLYALCLHVCRLPGTRNRAVCFVFACLQAAWYKEQGCMLCVCVCRLPGTRSRAVCFVCAGCLVQGAGLYALCLMLCRLPGTRSRAVCFVCAGCLLQGLLCVCNVCAGCLIQAAWYKDKEQGCMLCVCVCRLPGTRSRAAYFVCLCVCRQPGTRNRAVCFVFCVCRLQAAWYKEQGCMLCVFVSAGCLVQGAGLHTLCLCVQAAWYKEQGCMLCVFVSGCLVQGAGLHTLCVYVCAGSLVQGTGLYALCVCVCRLPGTRTSLYVLCVMCVQVV